MDLAVDAEAAEAVAMGSVGVVVQEDKADLAGLAERAADKSTGRPPDSSYRPWSFVHRQFWSSQR